MRVMYAECSGPVWRVIARRLEDRHGWRPVYWLAAPEDAAVVASEFPDAVFHSGVEAARGIPATGADWPLPGLDAALLEALAPHESITLHMMDRMDPDGRSFPYDERRRHYHDLLRYWLGVLDRFAPDLVVLSIAPHIVYDYVLYALCRHRGVPTVMFERIGLPGYVYPVAEIDTYPPGLQPDRRAVRETGAKPALSPLFEAYLAAQSAGGEKAMPANFEKKLKRYGLARTGRDGYQAGLTAELWFEFKRAAYLFRKNGFAPVPRTYVKLRGQRPADSHPTTWDLEVRRVRAILTKRRLRRLVHRLAERPVRDEPHVLLALHYQPERATVPMGGMLGDQALIADILAKSLPEGWWLYVKEHPWQLQGFSRGEMQRSEDFYRRLAALRNTRLMPLSADTGELIASARAVATVTGSVGWQAICQGVPALVFGSAWYRGCEGAFQVRSVSDCKAALDAVADGYRVEGSAPREWLAAVQEVCVPGFLEPDVESVEALDVQDAAEAMADALAAFVGECWPETANAGAKFVESAA